MLWICCRRFDLLWICCGFAVNFWFVVQLVVQQIHNKSYKPKLHLYDLLWIWSTTSCTTNPQQIHNILTWQDVVNLLWTLQQIHNKSTANRNSGVWILTSCGLVVALQPITVSCYIMWRLRTSLYVTAEMDVIDENVNNKQLHCSLTRSIAYHNKPILWGSNLNANEEKELAWFRLSSTFSTPAGLTCLMYVNHRYNKLQSTVLY